MEDLLFQIRSLSQRIETAHEEQDHEQAASLCCDLQNVAEELRNLQMRKAQALADYLGT